MNRQVRVQVTWNKEKMQHLPTGVSYSTVAKFPEDGDAWLHEAWSIVLSFPAGSAKKKSFEAIAHFLSPEAPDERLKSGGSFELYEGRRLVATAIITTGIVANGPKLTS